MKAAVFYGKGKIILEEHEYKKPGGDEVLIKVKAAGICGTDMHIYDGAKGASECYPPVVLGHEFAGIVTKVGADVTDIKAGDHVTVDPSIVCNECYECLAGNPHFCKSYSATGVTYDGGFAKYCTVRAKQVYKLKKDISFEAAAMCEPVGSHFNAKAKELGWDITVLDCQGNASTQISQVENFIEKGVDALIIYPADVEALTLICEEAAAAGIKILSWDENMDCADMAYLAENYQVGQEIGKQTAEWINEKYPDGCEVAVIDYATLPVIVDRANGIIDAIKEYAPKASIVAQDSALDAAQGMTLAENMLQANPDIKAFACIGDGSGIGVNEALKAKGVNLDEYGVFCCDATDEACQAIANNEAIRMPISLGLPDEMGDTALEHVRTMLESDDYEKEVYKVMTPVNADNIDKYYTAE